MIEDLLGAQGNTVVQQLGQQFGLSESQASSALGALLPALAAGFQRNASSASGIEALIGALSGGGHQKYLDDVQVLGRPETVDDGNGILAISSAPRTSAARWPDGPRCRPASGRTSSSRCCRWRRLW